MTAEARLGHELAALDTEASRPGVHLERLGTGELVAAQLECDRRVSDAVDAAADQITAALDTVVARLGAGGRMVYLGAGTPGRLAVLDAAECLPTFGVGPDVVHALIAGGDGALTQAVEGAEDDAEAGAADVRGAEIDAGDVVVGISASGRTPYVLGAIEAARAAGAATVCITNNPRTALAAAVDLPIETLTGPEFVTGSTRLKAGTAQKRVLNMLSTIAMVQLGKVHGTLMVDVAATNEKLRARTVRIVAEATGVDAEEAKRVLAEADGHAKTAIAALLLQVPVVDAAARLTAADGHLGRLLEEQP